jgi:hypothetical protein
MRKLFLSFNILHFYVTFVDKKFKLIFKHRVEADKILNELIYTKKHIALKILSLSNHLCIITNDYIQLSIILFLCNFSPYNLCLYLSSFFGTFL